MQRLPIHGKRVHDARLVAVVQAHGVEHLVTFNTSDFAVFPSLSTVDPHSLATPAEAGRPDDPPQPAASR